MQTNSTVVSDATESPAANDDSKGSDAKVPRAFPGRAVLRGLIGFGLVAVVGIALLLVASGIVVFVTGVAARWLGVPQLHLMLAFLGLFATLVVAFVGSRIASEIDDAGKRIESAVEDTGEQIEAAVDASALNVVNTVREIPTVVIDAGFGSNRGRRSSSRHNRG